MTENVACPYCGMVVTVDVLDKDNIKKRYREYCDHCNKYFALIPRKVTQYSTLKAPCFNDGEHRYEIQYESKYGTVHKCSICGNTLTKHKKL